MILRAQVWPVVLQLLVADGVPQLDVTESCRAAAQAKLSNNPGENLYKACVGSEQKTRTELAKNWSSYTPSDRESCISSLRAFAPTYTELATCLELKRAVADIKTKSDKTRQSTTGRGP